MITHELAELPPVHHRSGPRKAALPTSAVRSAAATPVGPLHRPAPPKLALTPGLVTRPELPPRPGLITWPELPPRPGLVAWAELSLRSSPPARCKLAPPSLAANERTIVPASRPLPSPRPIPARPVIIGALIAASIAAWASIKPADDDVLFFLASGPAARRLPAELPRSWSSHPLTLGPIVRAGAIGSLRTGRPLLAAPTRALPILPRPIVSIIVHAGTVLTIALRPRGRRLVNVLDDHDASHHGLLLPAVFRP